MLEYSFSIAKIKGEEIRLLRTKGDKISFSNGQFHSFSTDNGVEKNTYTFRVRELVKEDRDPEGNFYSWYKITDFNQIIDYRPEINKEIEKTNATLDYILMMEDLDIEEDDDDAQQEI